MGFTCSHSSQMNMPQCTEDLLPCSTRMKNINSAGQTCLCITIKHMRSHVGAAFPDIPASNKAINGIKCHTYTYTLK